MAKAKVVYWDSCAWLGLINGETDKKRALGLIFNGAERGHYEIWTSSVSLVEVSRHSNEARDSKPLSPAKLQTLDDLFRQPFVKVVPFDLETGILARRLFRETTGLSKKWDAAHLATAIRANTETLHTYDHEDLLHLSGKLECRNGNPLIICYPDQTTDGELFAKKGA